MAFFSAVDFDRVLRKEANVDCVTLSNPTPVPPGFALDIYALLAKIPGGLGPAVDKKISAEERTIFPRFELEESSAICAELRKADMLRLQIYGECDKDSKGNDGHGKDKKTRIEKIHTSPQIKSEASTERFKKAVENMKTVWNGQFN